MATKLVRGKAKPARDLDEESLPQFLSTYMEIKQAADEMAKKVSTMKATMMTYLDAEGLENDRGHKVIEVEGVGTIVRERRVSESLDQDVAEAWLEKVGKTDQVLHPVTIMEFDYDKFVAILYKDEVPQRQVDKFYNRNETFAFKILKG